jgi:hypothetical protein
MHLVLRSTLLLLALLTAPDLATAGPMAGERPVWFGIGPGFSGTAPAPDVGGGIATHFTLGLRLLPVSPELILRDGIAGLGSSNLRHVGGVGAGVRFLLPKLAILRGTFRVAFAHQHELAWGLYTENIGSVLKATFGVHEKIVHRTGFELGGGLELTPIPGGPLGFYVQVNAIVLPETEGPAVTVMTELGLSVAVGKPLE